jgi:hypothetical protein
VGEGSGLLDHPCKRLSPALRCWRKQGILGWTLRAVGLGMVKELDRGALEELV